MKKVTKESVERYDFGKKVKRISTPLFWLTVLVAKMGLRGRSFTVKKTNMEGLEPPYLVLGTHLSFFDLNTLVLGLYPHRINYVCALDAIRDYGEGLMRRLGIIGKRKFVADVRLLKNMKYSVDKLTDCAMAMYQEAKFSLDGTTSFIPASMGKLAKFLDVPVVIANMHGNYLSQPQWNTEHKFDRNKYRPPLVTEITQLFTREEVRALDKDVLQEKIVEALQYDEFRWQKDNNIVLDNPFRASGLNKLLYKCAHCGTEGQMLGEGTTLRCQACGKEWEMTPLGELKARSGETEYSHIPDWFDFQQACVAEEVRSGRYCFEDEVRVDTLPGAKRFYSHGMGRLVHDVDGFRLECNAYGEPTTVVWRGYEIDGVHIEYDYKKRGDVLDISTYDESYWVYPKKRDVITKISLATDEIFKYWSERKKNG